MCLKRSVEGQKILNKTPIRTPCGDEDAVMINHFTHPRNLVWTGNNLLLLCCYLKVWSVRQILELVVMIVTVPRFPGGHGTSTSFPQSRGFTHLFLFTLLCVVVSSTFSVLQDRSPFSDVLPWTIPRNQHIFVVVVNTTIPGHGCAAFKHQRVQQLHDAAASDRVSAEPERRHPGGSRLGPVAGAALQRVLLRLSQSPPGGGVHGQPDFRHRGWKRGHAHRLCANQAVPDTPGIPER